MTIAEAISNLLFEHETVVVPGLGAFVKKPVSAKVDWMTNRFTPPSSRVEFDAALREDNDLVVRYITEFDGVSEEEAQKALTAFVVDVFETLKTDKPFVLDGVGSLNYDTNGNITFEADGAANFNSDAFGLTDFSVQPVPPVEHKQVADEEDYEDDDEDELKSSPWFWALLAACILVGGFFGLKWLGVFNKETTQPVVVTNTPVEQPVAPTVIYDTLEAVQPDADTLEATLPSVEMTTPSVEVSTLSLTRKVAPTEYRVVAGCYDREEHALWYANVLHDAGYAEVFYEQHGERWFVSFAHYATFDEALEALNEIRKNTTYQAWILVPQEQ